ncbi:MAG: dioxygenase [Alphaproteobacteria bacterium]|nr:MAG: dioxygenase [Alphaproteobacteria bacterium]
MTAMPSLFVSHGPPTMVLDDIPVRAVLADLARTLPRPRAILCVSAHWIAPRPTVSLVAQPETIHDFFGFDEALYCIRYSAPGAPEVAERAAALIRAAGLPCATDPARGLDHGAWEPLMLMYPDADVPVTQLSLVADGDVAHHMEIGRALAPLRTDGVLILASGTAVHNLAEWRAGADGDAPPWAVAFEDWLVDTVTAGDAAALVDYRNRAPHARRAHPTEDHFLPLAVAMGAGGGADGAPPRGRVVHRGFSYGSLSMAAFAFDGDDPTTA